MPTTHPAAELPHDLPASLWRDEVVEPGIHNQRVELYRTSDAEEVIYADVNPLDKKGFHLTVFGTRQPVFATPVE